MSIKEASLVRALLRRIEVLEAEAVALRAEVEALKSKKGKAK